MNAIVIISSERAKITPATLNVTFILSLVLMEKLQLN